MKGIGLIFLICSLSCLAQQAPNSLSNRHALIIGVSEYQNPQIPTLTGVPYDMDSAKRIALAMGIPEGNIEFLKNSDATKENIINRLEKMGNSASEGARDFVYFSGHGTRYQDYSAGGCVEGLFSYDGQAITNLEFAAATKKLIANADKVITMIDACHSEGVVPPKSSTRSISIALTPKFFLGKAGSADSACAKPANQRTRGLISEATRMGALQENVVQITSSRPDEVSFDEPGKGGIATQAVRDCLLGRGKDIDNSGAVSIAEVQQCAQEIINGKLQNQIDYTPHHVTVTGNRNLIPVQKPKPPELITETPIVTSTSAQVVVGQQNSKIEGQPQPDKSPSPEKPADKLTEQIVANSAQGQSTSAYTAPAALPPTKIEDNTSALTSNQKPQHQSSIASSLNLASGPRPFKDRPVSMDKPSQIELELASMATLKDIQQQGNPKRLVTVTLSKASLKIGRDSLDLTIKSNHDGFVYIVLLGSDSKSFYILYPNGLDQNNRIHAGESLRVPKSDWQVLANGPVGTDNLLVMVSDSPRKLNGLNMASPTASEPFTYALNDIGGRGVLIDFLTGSGVDGKSESFGSTLVSLKEIK